MRHMRAWALGMTQLLLAVAAGAGAALGAVVLLQDHREEQVAEWQARDPGATEPRDRVREALAELADDGVYVSPDGRNLLDEAGERVVEQAIVEHPDLPVYVVVWADRQQVGASELVIHEQLERGLGPERGMLVVWEGPENGAVELIGGSGSVDGFGTASDLVGDPAITLPKAIAAAQDVSWYAQTENDYWGGVGGGIAAGVLFGGGILLGLLLVAFILSRLLGVRPLLPGRWTWREDA